MNNDKVYIAHKSEDGKSIQTLKQHSQNVAMLSYNFSIEELKQINYLIGLYHDIGKYQERFQRRINGENVQVEHSLCGGKQLYYEYKKNVIALISAYCILSHHTGLLDGGSDIDDQFCTTLNGRLKRNSEDYSAYLTDLKDLINYSQIGDVYQKKIVNFILNGIDSKNKLLDKFAFITRYCFSCLVDADSIDTATFNKITSKTLKTDFNNCLKKVDEYLKIINQNSVTDLQKTRSLIQKQVFSRVQNDAEIYLINMPTGSGKTLCSIKYALEKAIKNKKSKIIYVIPYNSIIDQTVDVLESILGDSANILRHQSTFYSNDDGEEAYNIRLATENWNADFIITTSVQFFETIYSNKRRKLRKFHNIQNSIIVFDEVQLMPQNLLQPCFEAIYYLSKILDNEILFLTATMPDYKNLFNIFLELKSHNDLKFLELCNVTDENLKIFKKCQYINLSSISKDVLVSMLDKEVSSLVIVNKRETARDIYKMLTGNKFYLSTYLTGYDRKRIINKIKDELLNLKKEYNDYSNVPEERRVKVVSTSLIEAGVDLDFFNVYREIAGLDNILQSGGRCNREGLFDSGNVYIFTLENEACNNDLQLKIHVTNELMNQFKNNIDSKECIERYYEQVFLFHKDKILANSFYKFNENNCNKSYNLASANFKSYSEQIFKIIEDNQISIVIPEDDISRDLISKLEDIAKYSLKISTLDISRKLQIYTCSIYPKIFEDLRKQGVLEDFGTGIWCLTNSDYYDNNLGIQFEGIDYII